MNSPFSGSVNNDLTDQTTVDEYLGFLTEAGDLDQQDDPVSLYDDGSQESSRWDEGDEDDFDSCAETESPTADQISALLAQLGQESEEALLESVPPNANSGPFSEPTALAAGSETPAIAEHTNSAVGSIPTIDSLDPELREAFLDDASSCVASMEDALLKLEADPQHLGSLDQICRELHTLKGASSSVGLVALADQLHKLEDRLRDDAEAKRIPEFDSLLRSVDSIREKIGCGDNFASMRATATEVSSATQKTSVTPIASANATTPSDDESVRVKSSQLDRLMDMLAELVMLRNQRETEVAALNEVYHNLVASVTKMRQICNGAEASLSGTSLQLSEITNDVFEVAQNVRNCALPVAEGNKAVSQFIRQFRHELVELKRTPIAGLFGRLQRVVRDAAQVESKSVQLKLVGENACIDRSLQQRLYEPLLHVVRNCVCHGIESVEQRGRLGKDPNGTITLEAKSGADQFTIEVRDDGGGLDYDAIRRRGIESGLISEGNTQSRDDLAKLIFQPGFSTRQEATQAAGRGVGMDVVATTLQRMRGWLDIESEPNRGTRIRLTFPLPSVIQHVMVFRAGTQLFAIPMQSVKSAGDKKQLGSFDSQSQECQLWMAQIIGQTNALNDSCQRIELAGIEWAGDCDPGSKNVALYVDEVVGPEEVVVRPLPGLLKQHPFCAGATLSGMGETVLLLDARRLVDSVVGKLGQYVRPTNSLPSTASCESNPKSALTRVLVVDDSISARVRVVRSLQRYPIEIVEACDGREAIEILKTQNFAAVFSDMEMPYVTGMELLASIKANPATDSIPVVMISSRTEDEYTDRAKELGAHRYLPKPLTDDLLDAALNDIPALTSVVQHT